MEGSFIRIIKYSMWDKLLRTNLQQALLESYLEGFLYLYSSNVFIQVSRTFGDAHAKIEAFGGNPKVVVAIPELSHIKL